MELLGVLLVSVGRPLHFVVNELLSWSERDSSRLACPLLKVLFRLPTYGNVPLPGVLSDNEATTGTGSQHKTEKY